MLIATIRAARVSPPMNAGQGTQQPTPAMNSLATLSGVHKHPILTPGSRGSGQPQNRPATRHPSQGFLTPRSRTLEAAESRTSAACDSGGQPEQAVPLPNRAIDSLVRILNRWGVTVPLVRITSPVCAAKSRAGMSRAVRSRAWLRG
jgi:hypothetical protein